MDPQTVQALAPFLHKAQLANAVTSFATCLGGIMPLLFTALAGRQPRRWVFVYACVLITGIPTVWLHAYEGNRVASFFDVGTNILLAWALQLAVAGDFLKPEARRRLALVSTSANLIVIGWLFLEISLVPKKPLLAFGSFGQFYVGEVALILNCFVVVGLFAANHARIPREARGLFYLIVAMFLCGLFLATAGNDQVSLRIFAWHSVWHLVGAFGFVTLWLFNHVRFADRREA
ncbi:MAG TPA: hypothetical protein P5318_12675 [Candidatus Hydrogenedentes bacterium]|nr:hypothetical protein [Candidatus Hydrogenedentota bacterium]HOV75239.1 hypothetical protein [Candidatus Hydrogenedentota bacterium]HPC17015.1 hypothetical protein [Candidatus Hydrogenedentota bacterium]HRT20973.1 hypothetical protein [Candidatus Hydrogenedentota bacterium]HRT65802.1 hypothetical protein [Candidatus Hydrogenedentota bacterium]